MAYILALDEGTSSLRSVIFDEAGNIISAAQKEITQYFPKPGWVEHDALEIWEHQLKTAQQVLLNAHIPASKISGLGITNQRETTVVWDRITGAPIYHAIVWQDRRTEDVCRELRKTDWATTIRDKTGLLLDAYFSATKIQWILNNVVGARGRAERGELLFGTIDTWLIWKLTKGRVHATDVTNASRTMLYNIHTHGWDDALLACFHIPANMLPKVYPSSYIFGQTDENLFGSSIKISGVAGDQQAALFGQACTVPGMAKNTYGTGCFILQNTGPQIVQSQHQLLTTVTCQSDAQQHYALEGSVFVGGAVVQWLRDGLGVIKQASDVGAMAASVPDSGGVIFVPALTGLGAPYWDANAKGAIVGLTRGTTAAHIVRAAVESIAFQSAALMRAMNRDATIPMKELRVDGGAAANNYLLQFQADLLGVPVVRPKIIETTVLGAAYLAGLAVGVYKNVEEINQHWKIDRTFSPSMHGDDAEDMMQQWDLAVKKVMLN